MVTRRFVFRIFLFCLVLNLALAADTPPKHTKPLVSEDYFVKAADPGIQLFVRNRHLKGVNNFTSDKIVLFVHGATYPADTSFDLPLDGMSWMDYIAQHGFDVYLMDVRGYSRSTRPPEMSQPGDKNPPIVDTDTAVRDVGAVVDNVLARRHVSKVNLIGWSWGTSIMAGYTAKNNDKVEKLVLYAPLWLGNVTTISIPAQLPAYRTVSMAAAKNRWLSGVPEDKKKDLIPEGWFEKWAEATQASDPEGAAMKPPVIRAPNGVLYDIRNYWMAGKPYFDPSLLKVPVLLINAEWDADTPLVMSQGLFEKLTNTPYKRRVIIGEGTHTVIMERNRMQLFREVQLFLDESRPDMK
jgi:pimeloyl-ACP methyl ester carboxylesterase